MENMQQALSHAINLVAQGDSDLLERTVLARMAQEAANECVGDAAGRISAVQATRHEGGALDPRARSRA